jgi:hypothetical protein
MNLVDGEKNFTSALINALALLPVAPSRDEVGEKAAALAAVFGYDGDLRTIIDEAMIAVDTKMGAGVSLIDVAAQHDEDWIRKREIEWTYSQAYEAFLRSERWHPTVVQSLSDVGMRILGHLQDPTSDGAWDRRGLVIGHVQSGKTANYMGVIAKAADAGYKFIIVIAGIHNNLRKQTQERIDEGFVGRSSDPAHRARVGVGLEGHYPHPVTLTNINDDFSKKTADQGGWRLNDFSKPIIFVIKKNVKTLDALHRWLKEMNAQGDGHISDVPMLMIDDEADNASINTNKEDLDPTKTNAMIRRILGLFEKSCYVGYTATPFANIFINPESYDDDVREELFPRDFIYCLDAPNTYFGPDKVFLDEQSSARILEPIDDCEDYLPLSHKSDHHLTELPPSLYRAINQFIVARAIRNLRGHANQHCSMMVNISRFVNIQQTIRDFISVYEKKVREAVKANYAMPDAVSDRNVYMLALKDAFLSENKNCGHKWKDVKRALWSVFDNLNLYVVNSKSDEVLDYRKYARDGHGLTAIAVGGLSLSRGLTIEGLCVSYMYRNTRMYDTLMQMGRWFGYRPGFEDLCRVYLSRDSIDWYSHIAEASEELRQQIKRMRRDNLSPRQFGLYVKAHPDQLLITAANKMRSGQRITVAQNFSGKLIESYIVPTDDTINRENENLIAAYWRDAFRGALADTGKGWTVQDVPVEIIEEFLVKFKVHPDFAERKAAALAYLQALTERHPMGDVLLISVAKNGEDRSRFRLGAQERASARRSDDAWRMSKDRVASRGDEKLGLTDAQQDEAKSIAETDEPGKAPSDFHYRSVRKKPLLMIHVLGPVGSSDDTNRVPAFGLSFPPGHYDTQIEVVANAVWIERMHGGSFDTPDEDEDYDD